MEVEREVEGKFPKHTRKSESTFCSPNSLAFAQISRVCGGFQFPLLCFCFFRVLTPGQFYLIITLASLNLNLRESIIGEEEEITSL